jgi:hypothetical protein
MSPTSGVYHSRPTDLVVGRISVGLENAFELSLAETLYEAIAMALATLKQENWVGDIGHGAAA